MRLTALAVAVLMLAGCGAGEPVAAETVTHTAEVTVSTAHPAVTITHTATATVTVTQGPTGEVVDWRQRLVDANPGATWTRLVSEVEPRSDGAEIRALIIDPRGEDGSPQAQDALAICEAMRALLKADGMERPSVWVMESDGSTFAMSSRHDDAGCTEQ